MTTAIIQNKPRYEGMKVTREEYLDLEEDGFKYDMIDGILSMSPSPFYKHGKCQIFMASILMHVLQINKTGEVVSEIDVYLPDGGDVLRPDITVILKENYSIIKGHIHGVPDIVVEVLSESTLRPSSVQARKRDLGLKADRYLLNGVKEYWIADPDEKSIELWINHEKKNWKKIKGDRLESTVLDGFIVEQEAVFPVE